ncbi:abortive infection family protein [Micromonospora rifamycinica]|uniref:abortive infection family protein n=1 Tax=Micromonospora rifamycinica TaxID=291594 RepID=UPI0033D066A2
MGEPNKITEVTRRRILDSFSLEKIAWAGRLEEPEFLARIYDLESLPSTDRRYRTASGDIWQHRVNNNDWDDDWVFYDSRFGLLHGSDETLLKFLAEMLHPVVRSDRAEVERLASSLNSALSPDGYELVSLESISGRPIYTGRHKRPFHGDHPALALEKRPLLTDPRVLHEHLSRIREAVERDPAAAIASCKELVESLCKIILDKSGAPAPPGDDLPGLYRRVADLLHLKAESVPNSAKGSQTAQRILRTLVTTVQSLAELRNELGLGHGRLAPSPALSRHARLSLNSTVAVTEFLLDTWHDRVNSGALSIP